MYCVKNKIRDSGGWRIIRGYGYLSGVVRLHTERDMCRSKFIEIPSYGVRYVLHKKLKE